MRCARPYLENIAEIALADGENEIKAATSRKLLPISFMPAGVNFSVAPASITHPNVWIEANTKGAPMADNPTKFSSIAAAAIVEGDLPQRSKRLPIQEAVFGCRFEAEL
jgi:hypothetical protein